MSEKTLVVYFARAGDLVMLTPVLRGLAAQAPVELLARPWGRELLGEQPCLAAVHTLAKPNLAAWEDFCLGGVRRRLGQRLASRGFTRIVRMDREHKHILRWLDAWAPGIPQTVIPLTAQSSSLHLVEANLAAAQAVGLPGAEPYPVLAATQARSSAAQARLAALGRRVVAVQAGSSLTHRWLRRQVNLKGLHPRQWGGLISRLLARGEADAVVLLGSAPEGREARAILAQVAEAQRGQVHDWTGQAPFEDQPALFAHLHACLSVDTGPAHIAAAVGCPLLVVFGPTRPERFLPRGRGIIETLIGEAPCRPCHGTKLFRTCKNNICLNGLSDAQLDAAFTRLATRISSAATARPGAG